MKIVLRLEPPKLEGKRGVKEGTLGRFVHQKKQGTETVEVVSVHPKGRIKKERK